jgi:hypothetical protein
MKNILLLAATILLCISSLQAQNKETKINRIYLFGGGGPALFSGASGILGISAVVNKKWIASVGYLYATRKASAPSDANFTVYRSSWFWGDFSINYHPVAETKFTYISLGRYYPATRKLSYILDAGIGIANGQDFNYYNRNMTSRTGEQVIPRVSSNYIVTQTDKTAIGAIGRAGMDWAFSGGAGMGFDFYYNYCGGGISDNVGFNMRLMIGYMPRAPKTAVKQ